MRVRELISVWVLGVGVRSRVGRVGTQSAAEEESLDIEAFFLANTSP